MLKERIGGTEVVEEKREEARRIVPSPPNVVTRSVLAWIGLGARAEGVEELVERGV